MNPVQVLSKDLHASPSLTESSGVKTRPDIITKHIEKTVWTRLNRHVFIRYICIMKQDQERTDDLFGKQEITERLNNFVERYLQYKTKDEVQTTQFLQKTHILLNKKTIIQYIQEEFYQPQPILEHFFNQERCSSYERSSLSEESSDDGIMIPREEFEKTPGDDHNRSDVKPLFGMPLTSRQTRSMKKHHI